MFAWAQKTFYEVKKTTINIINTPAPIGKVVLVAGIVVVGSFLVTHKVRVILVFG